MSFRQIIWTLANLVNFLTSHQVISQKVGLYPNKGADCFLLIWTQGLPEPAKADKEKVWLSLFFFVPFRSYKPCS